MTTQDLEKKIEELTMQNAELQQKLINAQKELEKETHKAETNWSFYKDENSKVKRLQEKLNVISKITEF